jgi:hypothetical protein
MFSKTALLAAAALAALPKMIAIITMKEAIILMYFFIVSHPSKLNHFRFERLDY